MEQLPKAFFALPLIQNHSLFAHKATRLHFAETMSLSMSEFHETPSRGRFSLEWIVSKMYSQINVSHYRCSFYEREGNQIYSRFNRPFVLSGCHVLPRICLLPSISPAPRKKSPQNYPSSIDWEAIYKVSIL